MTTSCAAFSREWDWHNVRPWFLTGWRIAAVAWRPKHDATLQLPQ